MLQFTEDIKKSNVIPLRSNHSIICPGSYVSTLNSLWVAERTGDWASDNSIGRDVASRGLEWMIRNQDTVAFVAAMRSLVRTGHYEGFEAGLLQQIAEHVILKTR